MSTADQAYLYNNYSKVAEFYPLNLHKFGQSEHMLCQELSGFAAAISAPVLARVVRCRPLPDRCRERKSLRLNPLPQCVPC